MRSSRCTSSCPERLRAASLLLWLLSSSACSHYLFFPDRWQRLTPDQIGLGYEDVEIAGVDGRLLHGWFLPARPDGVEPRAWILFLHGNAENVSTHIASVAWLPSRGYAVLLLDYSGFGRSEGEPDVDVVHEDARSALDALRARPGVDPDRVALFGQSMGAAVTLELARRSLADDHAPCAVVADSAFTSYRDIAREKLALHWLTWPLQVPLSWTVPGEPRPVDAVGALDGVPLVLVHGDADVVVPVHHAHALAAAAPEGTPLWIGAGAGHIETLTRRGMRRRFVDFLDRACDGGVSASPERARAPAGSRASRDAAPALRARPTP